MKYNGQIFHLYAVTDRSWTKSRTLEEQVREAVIGGATCVQLREKHLDKEKFLEETIEMVHLCAPYGVPLIINDDIEVARAGGAAGVHLGQKDAPPREARQILGDGAIIGATAHNVAEAVKAEADGADYIGAGAVFATDTKADTIPLPYEELKKICGAVSIPVVAIGGITAENIGKLAGSGIAGVAVVSAIFAADDIGAAARELRELSQTIFCNDDMPPIHGVVPSSRKQ